MNTQSRKPFRVSVIRGGAIIIIDSPKIGGIGIFTNFHRYGYDLEKIKPFCEVNPDKVYHYLDRFNNCFDEYQQSKYTGKLL